MNIRHDGPEGGTAAEGGIIPAKDHIHSTPANTGSIADAIVIKEQNLFLLTDPDGRVPLSNGHGLGLYFNDCRYLSGYELSIAGCPPQSLAATAGKGFMAILQLSGENLTRADGSHLPQEELGIRWDRVIDGAAQTLYERLVFDNFSQERMVVPVSFSLRSQFEDVFAVRELLPDHLGQVLPPVWQDGALRFGYQGADRVFRSLTVSFSPAPATVDGSSASYEVVLEPRQRFEILTRLTVAEAPDSDSIRAQSAPPDMEQLEEVLQRASDTWLRHETFVRSDSLALNRIMERSFRDLYILRSRYENAEFFAAGVPWFATLFGRDSLITALQTLAYDPAIAEQTLRLLARYQGALEDDWRDEQPGKILHELRTGEMAQAGRIPHSPYYGTVDATPLFLVLLGRHANWTGDLSLFNDLRPNVEAALSWIAATMAGSPQEYLAYERRSAQGLANQGWKDSHDGIINSDGTLATPPIALVEVQGYVYLALTLTADLYQRAGEADRSAELRRQAEALRVRFNRDFWLGKQQCYALALQAGGRQADVVSSNTGHVLWTGIADADRAEIIAARLLEDDMFSGWGIRTLSSLEPRYNPLGYHLGSVWPHDNAMIVAGLRHYGCDDAAHRVFMSMMQAAMDFDQYRLPELFAGFSREDYGIPVPYPVACRPQAWAAGTIPYMLESTLGLQPEAFENRLRIVRPRLPDPTYFLEIHGLRVGSASVALRFDRVASTVVVRVLRIEGPLDVIVEGAGIRA